MSLKREFPHMHATALVDDYAGEATTRAPITRLRLDRYTNLRCRHFAHRRSRLATLRRISALAIGDGLPTDIVGAAMQGFDAIFVAGGIHAGEPFPEDFAEQNGLGDWQPIAIVNSLG